MKKRKLKVCEATCVSTKNTPCIGLQGGWLARLGYKIGEEVIVGELNGWLVIRPAVEDESVEQD